MQMPVIKFCQVGEYEMHYQNDTMIALAILKSVHALMSRSQLFSYIPYRNTQPGVGIREK